MSDTSFRELRAKVAARKAELGIEDTEESLERLRNKGKARTPAKRELLKRIEERARAAGLEPIKSHYEAP